MALALATLLALPAEAGQGPDFDDRPGVGQPLRFTDSAGNVFRPRRLAVVTDAATLVAKLPASTDDARSEDHLDFSGAPMVGRYFRERLAPADAARHGVPVGPLTRIGDTLVLDARGSATPVHGLQLVLTADFPRDGTVSYRLRPPGYAPGDLPRGEGRPAGTAWLVDGHLVLAGPGRGELITDWGAILGGKP